LKKAPRLNNTLFTGFINGCTIKEIPPNVFINPVIPPACAPEDTLVRVALMATHTKAQVDQAVDVLSKCFKQLGILK
jgi:4-aminobutyrate aminotransferase-like enzyme